MLVFVEINVINVVVTFKNTVLHGRFGVCFTPDKGKDRYLRVYKSRIKGGVSKKLQVKWITRVREDMKRQ